MQLRLWTVAALLSTACGSGLDASNSRSSAVTVSDGGDPQPPTDAGAPGVDAGTSPTESCDCNGMALPDICMVCSDGMAACAHFVCNAGMCQVQLCP